jgi:hypothetical protein
MTPEEFPPNSKKAKEGKGPRVEKPVVQALALETTPVIRKRSVGRRFKDVFLGGDFKRAAGYAAYDVAIPMLRDMLWAVISKGSERVIYPESRRQAGRPSGLFAPRIQYNSPVQRDPRELTQPGYSIGPSRANRDPRQRHDIGELILGSREEAQLVVESLIEYIDKYDVATVGDLYGLLGHEATFVNEQWGWTNLASVEIKHVSQGYLVEFPDPEYLGR